MIKLAKIFQSGMTLQRNKAVRIWGISDCAQSVTVKIDGKPVLADEKINNEFVLTLPAREAGINCILSIEGTEDQITLDQIDFGEVWLAGGHSNMQFHLRYDEEASVQMAAASDQHLRFFDVAEYAFAGEADDGFKDNSGWDRWMSFNPDDAAHFSAVGFYFSRILRQKLNVPVAVVGCNWGGTSAATWLDRKWLETDSDLRIYISEYEAGLKQLDMETYAEKNRLTRKKLASPMFIELFDQLLYGDPDENMLARLAEYAPTMFSSPLGPHDANRPGGLYESMLSHVKGLSCAGVIWYQGESDVGHASLYAKLFSRMISCWRRDWNEILPFLFVQLAPFGSWLGSTGEQFPVIRRQQDWVSKHVANTYMASIMDSGMEHDIHPKRKRPVGERLALLAIGKVYDQAILCESPELLQAEHERDTLTLAFKNTGSGLRLKGSQINALQVLADKKPVSSYSALTDVNHLILRSESFAGTRLTVLFAQTPYCEVNLYNSADIPAKPFIWEET